MLILNQQQIDDIMYFYEGSEFENEDITWAIKFNRIQDLTNEEIYELVEQLYNQTMRFVNYEVTDNFSAEEVAEEERYQESIENLLEIFDKMKKPIKQRLFVDMDGTLAKFQVLDTLEPLFEKGYFENLKPQQNVVEAVKNICASGKVDVYILSSYLKESEYALAEKHEWLDKYLPEIDHKHRVFCVCGQEKKKFIPQGIKKRIYCLMITQKILHLGNHRLKQLSC